MVSKLGGFDHEDILRGVSDELMRLSRVVGSLVRSSRSLDEGVPTLLQKSAPVWQSERLVNGTASLSQARAPEILSKVEIHPAYGLLTDGVSQDSYLAGHPSGSDVAGPMLKSGPSGSTFEDNPPSLNRSPSLSVQGDYTSDMPAARQAAGSRTDPHGSEALLSTEVEEEEQRVAATETRGSEHSHDANNAAGIEVHRCYNSQLELGFHGADGEACAKASQAPRKTVMKLAQIWQRALAEKSEMRSEENSAAKLAAWADKATRTHTKDLVEQKPQAQVRQSSTHTEKPWQSWIIVHPTARRRLAWDLLGMTLLSYDMVVVPLQAFNPDGNDFTDALSWTSLTFWTLDVPFSFFTGYQAGEFVEMNLMKIARHYFRTWFLFDICVLVVDWVTTVANEVGTSATSLVRLLKGLRFVRVLRLLRLLKAGVIFHEFLEHYASDMVLILADIAKLIVFVLFSNHVIACVWYTIGVLDGFDRTWVKANRMEQEGRDIYYRYFTSLHWSMTQFTPASMEVVPANTLERVYTVLVLFLAMITFSSVVSSITNAASQLRNLNKHRLEEYAALRRYLSENKVSAELASTIWAYIHSAWDKSQRRYHESDVLILSLLPRSLRSELQNQVYTPILSVHPFFGRMSVFYPILMQKLYRHGLQEVSLATGQELFSPGERGDTMFFAISGLMTYQHAVEDHDLSVIRGITRTWTMDRASGKTAKDLSSRPGVLTVEESDWVAEPAMWTEWQYVGRLSSRRRSELLALKCNKFQRIALDGGAHFPEAAEYAKLWVVHMNSQKYPITDICLDVIPIENLVVKAFFPEFEDEEVTGKTSSVKKKGSKKGKSTRSSLSFGLPKNLPNPRVSVQNMAHSWKFPSRIVRAGSNVSSESSVGQMSKSRRSIIGFAKMLRHGGHS